MGTFLSCGIAETIIVKKERKDRKEILDKLKKTIDLNLYNDPLENEDYLLLKIKKEFLEKYAVKFVEEQLNLIARDTREKENYQKVIEELKNKKYKELMEIAEKRQYAEFQLIEGNQFSNDISYIAEDLTTFADIIIYLFRGKVLMEEYYGVFRYMRNLIIKNSNNPIKTSVVVSIVG